MQDNRLLGIGCMLAAMAMISVQEAFAKYLGQSMPIPQVVWARYIGHLSLMVIWLWPKHGSSLLRANRPFMQIGRSLLLLIDTSLAFWGLTMIGLAELTAIFFTVPLLVAALAIPILKERVGIRSLLAIMVGFSGTLVIIRPGFDGLGLGALLVFGAACCVALFNVTTRKLANDDPMPVTLFYTALVGAIASSLALPFFWQTPDTPMAWAAFVSIGLFGGIAHSLMVASHKYAPASTVAPFMYTQVFWALGLGWVLFGNLPDQYAFMGGGIVILSGLYLIHRGRIDSAKPPPAQT